MITRKSFIFGCILMATRLLVPAPTLLNYLERNGNGVGIIGITTEDWYLTSDGERVAHTYLKEDGLKDDSDYKEALREVFCQQMSFHNYENISVEFLLEARNRKGKTPLFPRNLGSYYTKNNNKNQAFLCRNIWKKDVEYLLRAIGESKKQKISGRTAGYYEKIFSFAEKGFKNVLICEIANLDGEKACFLNDYLKELKTIRRLFTFIGETFPQEKTLVLALNKIEQKVCKNHKKNCSCGKRKIANLVDSITDFYWGARYFTKVMNSQNRRCSGAIKTIIVCNVDTAEQVAEMLEKTGYVSKYLHYDDSNKPVSEKRIAPYDVKSFVNFVIGCCNVCGKNGKNMCGSCKKAFYCCKECQESDRKNHKKGCQKKVPFAREKDVFSTAKKLCTEVLGPESDEWEEKKVFRSPYH
ncbi:zinc finger MYND domain-containing protein [Candidatus Dependentiae bacterium]|nr:zinc finger MYND domain-containing protein [Candidatus Dependentiae bacterium]